jgi:2-methylisocitrate lyase-like PEP mutase family enzyme
MQVLSTPSEYTTPAQRLAHSPNESLSTKASIGLRELLVRPEIVIAPGVCDRISARCALEAWFDVPYQRYAIMSCLTMVDAEKFLGRSGAATAAAKLGQPDLAIATSSLPDFVKNARIITSLSYSTPLVADADTGFGEPAMVARNTVQMYDRAGVAALHIEDQVNSSCASINTTT